MKYVIELAIYGSMVFFGILIWLAGAMWTVAKQGKRPNHSRGE